MVSECTFEVGQLVEYKTWYEGDGGWISIENQIGLVLEIIRISEIPESLFGDDCSVIYDIKVYWIEEEKIETVPDILLCGYEGKVII